MHPMRSSLAKVNRLDEGVLRDKERLGVVVGQGRICCVNQLVLEGEGEMMT